MGFRFFADDEPFILTLDRIIDAEGLAMGWVLLCGIDKAGYRLTEGEYRVFLFGRLTHEGRVIRTSSSPTGQLARTLEMP